MIYLFIIIVILLLHQRCYEGYTYTVPRYEVDNELYDYRSGRTFVPMVQPNSKTPNMLNID